MSTKYRSPCTMTQHPPPLCFGVPKWLWRKSRPRTDYATWLYLKYSPQLRRVERNSIGSNYREEFVEDITKRRLRFGADCDATFWRNRLSSTWLMRSVSLQILFSCSKEFDLLPNLKSAICFNPSGSPPSTNFGFYSSRFWEGVGQEIGFWGIHMSCYPPNTCT